MGYVIWANDTAFGLSFAWLVNFITPVFDIFKFMSNELVVLYPCFGEIKRNGGKLHSVCVWLLIKEIRVIACKRPELKWIRVAIVEILTAFLLSSCFR